MIGILDYGAGNLRSVLNGFAALGEEARLVESAEGLDGIERMVLPGDGHFGTAMGEFARRGFLEPVRAWIAADKPFIGICLGIQLVFELSDEAPGVRGLGSFAGSCKLFPGGSMPLPGGGSKRLKVPQMGWNPMRQARPDPIFDGVPDGAHFYFIHSYYPEPADPSLALGISEYGVEYCAMIGRGRVYACQFHPEKSGAAGMRLLDNWRRL
jgi:imidazole glycerol phosphate synthase glutamine amidotransferase subunit